MTEVAANAFTRNAIAWLLIAQLAAIAPHFEHLPFWMTLVYFGVVVWRLGEFQGRWGAPGKLIRAALVVGCFSGVGLSYSNLFGLEPAVALLISGFLFKLTELKSPRDYYVMVFLAYFVIATAFLFSQSLIISAYALLAILLVTAALVATELRRQQRFVFFGVKKSAVILLQAIPLTVILFLVFPRIGPLWKVPLPSQQGTTGVSDTMAPGEITSLARSSEIAFRAKFSGELPKRKALYWRGMTLSDFDGQAWRMVEWNRAAQTQSLNNLTGQRYQYAIIQEPTQQPWLFTLAVAQSESQRFIATQDFSLVARKPLREREQFTLTSIVGGVLEPEIPEWRFRVETKLPETGNKQSRELAERWFWQSDRNPQQFVNKVLTHFNQQAFFYTLQPPALGKDSVDEFLLKTRSGFCEHYASSFVFLMRAVNIPARVVTGYQGGELNPHNQTLTVRQYDAHAWAEVWLEGKGWQRIDPTAAVAPERIEQSLQAALQRESRMVDTPVFSPLRYRHVQWINLLRLRIEALDYYWARWVLNYDSERQAGLLRQIAGVVNPKNLIVVAMICACFIVAVVFWQSVVRGNRRVSDPATVVYNNFCTLMRRRGCARNRGEAPDDYLQRIKKQFPDYAEPATLLTKEYVSLHYANAQIPEREITKRMKLALRELKRI